MSKIYAYEVTYSSIPTVSLGQCLIDTEQQTGREVRSWDLYNATTGTLRVGFAARRQERICERCYHGTPGQVRPHGHNGPHGPGEKYQPTWIKAAS